MENQLQSFGSETITDLTIITEPENLLEDLLTDEDISLSFEELDELLKEFDLNQNITEDEDPNGNKATSIVKEEFQENTTNNSIKMEVTESEKSSPLPCPMEVDDLDENFYPNADETGSTSIDYIKTDQKFDVLPNNPENIVQLCSLPSPESNNISVGSTLYAQALQHEDIMLFNFATPAVVDTPDMSENLSPKHSRKRTKAQSNQKARLQPKYLKDETLPGLTKKAIDSIKKSKSCQRFRACRNAENQQLKESLAEATEKLSKNENILEEEKRASYAKGFKDGLEAGRNETFTKQMETLV